MKRSLILTAAVLISACGVSPEQQLADARKSYAAHRFSEARLGLLAALDAHPGDAAVLDMLGRTQLEMGDGEAALATLGRLGALGKAPADAAILKGDAELLRGQPDKAEAAVAQLATAEAWRVRALSALQRGDAAGAEAAFAKGSAAAGPKARLLAERARLALLRGDAQAAGELAAKSLAEGETLEGRLAAAQHAASRGDFAKALAGYEAAAARWPESRAALVGRIATLGDLGRTDEMKPLLAQATQRAPDDLTLTYIQARLAAAEGDWKGTRARLQPIEARMDAIPQARLLYGQALAKLGQPQQAQAQLKSYLARDPANGLARRLMAQAQLAAGDAGAAVKTMRAVASGPGAGPEELAVMAAATKAAGADDAGKWAAKAQAMAAGDLGAKLARADAAMKRSDWRSAAQAYRQVVAQTSGDNVLVLNNLAYAESELGNKREALALARRALKLAPDNASVLDTAGWLMVQTGADHAEGLALLRRAARLAPNNAAIARHLAQASRETPATA